MPADLIIRNARIVTMDDRLPQASALAVKDGHIMALGREEDLKSLQGANTQLIDADGRLVLPGFTDCHVHLTSTGLDMMRLDMSACASLDDFKKMITERIDAVKAGQWILGTGYNELVLKEKRLPAMKELDAISPDNPVWLSRVDGHSCLVNSKAASELKIQESTPGVERGGAHELTGVLRADANSQARQAINGAIDKQTRREAVRNACAKLLSVGITSVHALEGGSLFCEDDVDLLIEEMENLPMHIKLFHQTTDVKKVVERGFRQIGGCLLIDGALGSRTAALCEEYADAPGEYGVLYFQDKELQEFVWEAHSKGLQITVHAIGDAAIEQIITAYEKALAKKDRPDHRHRIEHYSLPTQSQIARCVQAGIIMSVQPSWARQGPLTNATAPARLGQERIRRLYPLATLLKAGGKLCGGSDSPIAKVGPLLGISGAVNHFLEKERISRQQAVSLHTRDAAWAVFEESERGRLLPGYAADMVVLAEDVFKVPAERIAEIPLELTIVGGKIAYSAESEVDGKKG